MTDEKLYGVHPVLEALQTARRHIRKVLISTQRRSAEVQRIIALAEHRGIPVVTVERLQVHQLVGHNAHQGIVAFAEPHVYQPWLEVVIDVTTMSGPCTILFLDSVTDVGNFAALIRSAAAFGVHAILIPRHAAVSLTPAVAKLSAGAIERISIVRIANVVRALEELKQQGFWVYGTDMQAECTVAQMAWPERVVLVLGAEGDGIRRYGHLEMIPRRGSEWDVPSLRGAVTLAATTAFPDQGAVLIASDDGQPVYARLGYRPVEDSVVFVFGD